MKFKKITSLVVTTSIVLSLAIPTFAEEVSVANVESQKPAVEVSESTLDTSKAKISKDKAKEIVANKLKEYFDTEIDDKKFQTSIQYTQNYFSISPNNKYGWQMDFNMYTPEKSLNISVFLDADTGKIRYLNKYENDNSMPGVVSTIPTITFEQAKKNSESFINRINPDEAKQVKLVEDNNSKMMGYYGATAYNFNYIRSVNGIPFLNDSIMIGVDGVSGKITSYSYSWTDDAVFPANKEMIDDKKAMEYFEDIIDLKLSYFSDMSKPYYTGEIAPLSLIYEPDYSKGSMIDANSGSVIESVYMPGSVASKKDLTKEEKIEYLKKSAKVNKLDKEIDSDKAKEIISKIAKELFGEVGEIDNVNYTEQVNMPGNPATKTWSAQINKKGEDMMSQPIGFITIDALTERIISFSQNYYMGMQYNAKFEPKITWNEGYYKALDVIAKYFPQRIGNFKTELQHYSQAVIDGVKQPEPIYNYNFTRVENGVEYNQNNISISVNAKTGEINDLYCNWNDDVKFPEVKDILKLEDAKKIYFDSNKPELMYTYLDKTDDKGIIQKEYKLAYMLKPHNTNFYAIDAKTGKWIKSDGAEVNENDKAFAQAIKGNWAEKELSILAYQGIIDTKDFKLDKEVTRMEAIKMLVNIKGYNPYMLAADSYIPRFTNISKDDADYTFLRLAKYYGLLEDKEVEFKKDEKITREEIAEMLVKILGYDELAKSKDIFVLNFKDSKKVSADKKGYVAICKGLSIINGNDGNLRPKDVTNIQEFAAILFRTMSKIKR